MREKRDQDGGERKKEKQKYFRMLSDQSGVAELNWWKKGMNFILMKIMWHFYEVQGNSVVLLLLFRGAVLKNFVPQKSCQEKNDKILSKTFLFMLQQICQRVQVFVLIMIEHVYKQVSKHHLRKLKSPNSSVTYSNYCVSVIVRVSNYPHKYAF